MKKYFWAVWVLLSLVLAGYYAYKILYAEDKTELLIGSATYGHYQIEMACETCHTDPFGGKEVLQDACVSCHAEELEEAHDSHPKSKFTDPREAYRLEILDARYCLTCHTEHQHEQTRTMGVTIPEDYCFHCHTEVGEERESHKGLAFDSCASAGCHNYHDNRALYETFLVNHSGKPKTFEPEVLGKPSHAQWTAMKNMLGKDMVLPVKGQPFEPDAKDLAVINADIVHQWQSSAHAEAGINCSGCHQQSGQNNTENTWIEKPGVNECKACHSEETKGFLTGKHGMRLALNENDSKRNTLAITPGESHLVFNKSAYDIQHGCNSCHGAHDFNTQKAAVESCLMCHNDAHSVAYQQSPHGKMRNQLILQGLDNANAVTCATCHMPRIEAGKVGMQLAKERVEQMLATHKLPEHFGSRFPDGEDDQVALLKKISEMPLITVQHNQNWNLRPNEKMIRPVCLSCHSLEFSIDALADPLLIENNFNGEPSIHIESVDWALKRAN